MATISSINKELVNLQSATAVKKAEDLKKNGAKQDLDGDAFLQLMMAELKNQDPLDPMDNAQMLAQEAQFTQIQEMQKLNATMSQSAIIQQANSLVGKTVQLVDPNNSSRIITGLVTSANFANGSTTITVNGRDYDLGYVTAVTDGAKATGNDVLKNKKLGDLNGASGITDGYVFLTLTDSSYNAKNIDIQVKPDMTVKDFIDEIEKAGLSTTLENGVLTIDHGKYRAISITQGKSDNNSLASNIVQKMGMFLNEKGNIESAVIDFNR